MEISVSYKKRLLFVLILCLLGVVLFFIVQILRVKKNSFQFDYNTPKSNMGVIYPAQIIDLSNWNLTLPEVTASDKILLTTVRQPALATYFMDPWFVASPDKKGVVFRAPVNASTTENSNYPRSELREMTADGSKEAFWSSTAGIHTLFIEEAITAVPMVKQDVVAGQIHGDDDDLIVIRLEYPKLFISRGSSNLFTLDEKYTLGKRFSVKFLATDGKIMVYYNEGLAPVYILEKKVEQAYFKVGVYIQSNCDTEGEASLCSSDNYGEVIVYKTKVTHE